MYRLTSNIAIGKFDINFVVDVQIESSWANLTDTCTIQLPEKTRWRTKPVYSGTNALFKPGDAVLVKLGYNYRYKEVFTGTLTKVKLAIPLELKCEDKMRALKEHTIKSYSKRSVSLAQLLTDVLPSGISVKASDIDLGMFRIANATAAEVIDQIKKDYGMQAFFRNGTLYCGIPYTLLASEAITHKFDLQKNVASSDNLEYFREDEIKLKVKAISILKDNSKLEVELGDKDGEQRTLNYYDKSLAELKKAAQIDLEKLKYEGFRGSFEAFGEPFVRFGDFVELKDARYPDRQGKYLVKSVKYKFGQSGYRQTIELERKGV